MNKRTVIFIIGFLAIAVVSTTGLIALSKSGKTERTEPPKATHDETNSDNHHSKDTENSEGAEVAIDLTNQSSVSMDIKDFEYSRPHIKIKKGTTVTWTNQDAIQHNVMQEHENDNDAHDAPTKDEEKSDVLASRLLSKGESYSYTFNEVNSSPYHCSPHPYMKGSVTVVE